MIHNPDRPALTVARPAQPDTADWYPPGTQPPPPCTSTGRHYYLNTPDGWTCKHCQHQRDNPLCPCPTCQADDLDQLRTRRDRQDRP